MDCFETVVENWRHCEVAKFAMPNPHFSRTEIHKKVYAIRRDCGNISEDPNAEW